jgi:hypothetical protein
VSGSFLFAFGPTEQLIGAWLVAVVAVASFVYYKCLHNLAYGAYEGSVGPERSFVEFETFAHRLQGSSFHLGVSYDKLGVYHQQLYGPDERPSKDGGIFHGPS